MGEGKEEVKMEAEARRESISTYASCVHFQTLFGRFPASLFPVQIERQPKYVLATKLEFKHAPKKDTCFDR